MKPRSNKLLTLRIAGPRQFAIHPNPYLNFEQLGSLLVLLGVHDPNNRTHGMSTPLSEDTQLALVTVGEPARTTAPVG